MRSLGVLRDRIMKSAKTQRFTVKLCRIATVAPAVALLVATLLWVGQDCISYQRQSRELRRQILQDHDSPALVSAALEEMAERRESMIAQFAIKLALMLLATALLTALSASISRRLVGDLTREFDGLEAQLQRAVSEQRAIDLDAFKHDELRGIAREINHMRHALRESEACYRTVFENTGTAMCMIAADGTILLVNEEFARHTGSWPEETEGQRRFAEFMAPQDLDRMRDYHEARRTGSGRAPDSYEMAYLDGEGRQRHALITVGLIPGSTTSVASLLDITERKRAEEEMRLTNARLEILNSMSQEINAGLAPCDAVQNSCDRLKELLGCHYVELFLSGVGDSDEDAGAPAWGIKGPLIARSCAPLVTCGTEPREFVSREELLGMISELGAVRGRDAGPVAGRILDALRLGYTYLVPVPGEGGVVGQLAVGRDASTPLAAREKRFLKQYSEQLGLLITKSQTEQRLHRVNECFLGFTADPGENTQRLIELCGEVLEADWAAYVRLDSERLRGVACWHLPEGFVPPPDPTGLVCEMVMKSDDSDVFHLTGLRQSEFAASDPSVRDFGAVSYLGKAVRCDAGTLGCVCTFYRDHYEATEEDRRLIGIIAAAIRVEEERMAVQDQHDLALADLKVLNRDLELARREAEEANNLKSEFLANTSHEIRTPLNGIIGYLQLVLNDLCDDRDEEREFISGAHESAEHLLALINDVLDVARIEAGKLRVDPEEVSVPTLLADVHSLVRVQAEQGQLDLTFRPVSEDLTAWCDEERLRQVLINVIGNAIKFTPEHGMISVGATAVEGEGVIRFEIADNGIGIAPEKLNTIFEKFVQADGTTTRQRGGSGLGLTISQRLVEMMGGSISAHSDGDGCGSTFTFSIPLHRGDARSHRGAPLVGLPEALDGSKSLAMVVEDDPLYRDYLCELLEKLGCQTIWAATADEALALAENYLPELITIDYSLPACEGARLNTGWELLAELQHDESLSSTAMILVTGDMDAISRKLASEHLPDRVEVMDKRTVPRQLAGCIEQMMVTGDRERPGRILIADDDPAFRTVIERMLDGRGYEIEQVLDGADCLDYLADHAENTDLLLLDLKMPGVSGYDVLRNLRRGAGTAELTVLVVTAYPEPESFDQRVILAGGGRTRILTKSDVLAAPSRFHALIEELLHLPQERLGVEDDGEDSRRVA